MDSARGVSDTRGSALDLLPFASTMRPLDFPKLRRNRRRRSCGTDGGLPARQTRRPRGGDRSRSGIRRRHLEDGALPRLSLRHQRPPFLFQVEGSRRSVDRDFARRHAGQAAFLAHSLSRQVFRLSAERPRGAVQAWLRRIAALPALVSQGAPRAHPRAAQLRGVGQQSIRPPAFQHLFQDLHRESVGHELQGNLRGLGGSASRAVAEQGDPQRCCPSGASRAAKSSRRSSIPSISAARARDDVGTLRGKFQAMGGRLVAGGAWCVALMPTEAGRSRRSMSPARRRRTRRNISSRRRRCGS